MSLTRRLQVLVDDERYERLERESERTGASIGALVRTAIDERYSSVWPSPEEAGRGLLEAEPMPVGDWEDMERELEDRFVEPHER